MVCRAGTSTAVTAAPDWAIPAPASAVTEPGNRMQGECTRHSTRIRSPAKAALNVRRLPQRPLLSPKRLCGLRASTGPGGPFRLPAWGIRGFQVSGSIPVRLQVVVRGGAARGQGRWVVARALRWR